jgi:transposase
MFSFKSGVFQLPNVPQDKQLGCCLSIMTKQQKELIPLRKQTRNYQTLYDKLRQQVQKWKDKYQKAKEELKKTHKENENLKKEIEKLTKTNARYQVSLFDHGNFKSQEETKNKKEKGGQKGHADTNRESHEDYSTFFRKRIFAKTCGRCHKPVKRVSATKEKILIDIIINPTAIKMILESERQWCGNCQKEVNVKDSHSLPFTEYGINCFMIALILRFKCHSSFTNISKVISISHGLVLSKSDVVNLLNAAKKHLHSRYETLVESVRKGKVMYNDETGWLVNGQSAWMWIMASEETTVYYAAESRGRRIMEEIYGNSQALSMHDGLASYLNSIPSDKSLYCWAHILRYAFEETYMVKKYSTPYYFRKKLVNIYRLKDKYPSLKKDKLLLLIKKELESLINQKSKSSSIINIQKRLKSQKMGLIRALVETSNGTNNLAERELRPMVINKRISYGSDTFSGMETTAILGSIIQTLSKKEEVMLPTLKTYLQTGIQEKYPQYLHRSYFDSS